MGDAGTQEVLLLVGATVVQADERLVSESHIGTVASVARQLARTGKGERSTRPGNRCRRSTAAVGGPYLALPASNSPG